jgi:hypothetical protein
MQVLLGAFILATIIIVAAGLLFSLPVMLLWNGCLVGAVNGINEISWPQAWGILVLCGLLFRTHINKKD